MKNGEQKAPKLVVRVIRVGGQEWRGEGATEAEAFAAMKLVEGK